MYETESEGIAGTKGKAKSGQPEAGHGEGKAGRDQSEGTKSPDGLVRPGATCGGNYGILPDVGIPKTCLKVS